MEAGRQLDALVAEEVMWLIKNGDCWSPYDNRTGAVLDVCLPLPHYSTDITAAWQVLEKIRTRGWQVTIKSDPWSCDFGSDFGMTDGPVCYMGSGPTISLPHAICLAALAAVGVEIEAATASAR